MSGRTPAGGSADKTRPPLARMGSSPARGPTLSTANRPGSSASVRSTTSSTTATARQPLRLASVEENKRPTLNGVSRRMSSMNAVPTTSRPQSRLNTTSSPATRTPTAASRTTAPRAPLNATPRATGTPTTINRTPRLAATPAPGTPKTPATAPKVPAAAPKVKATTPRKLAVRTSLGNLERPTLSSPVTLTRSVYLNTIPHAACEAYYHQ